MARFLSKQRLDLASGQGAAVPDLAHFGILDLFAELGSNSVVKARRFDLGLLVKEVQDDLVLRFGHGSGGEVTDQSAVALGGFSGGEDGEGSVRVVDLEGGTAASVVGSGEGYGAEGEALEEQDAAAEGEGGAGATGQGQGGCGGSGGSGGLGDQEEGHGGLDGATQKGQRSGDFHVHSVSKF